MISKKPKGKREEKVKKKRKDDFFCVCRGNYENSLIASHNEIWRVNYSH